MAKKKNEELKTIHVSKETWKRLKEMSFVKEIPIKDLVKNFVESEKKPRNY